MRASSELRENLGDIQGNLLRGYGHPYAAYLFLGFSEAAEGRAWLGRMVGERRITTAQVWAEDPATGRPRKPPATTNLALSFRGVSALGVRAERLRLFPRPFRQGMAARAQVLGDHGASAPARWMAGQSDASAHALVIVTAESLDQREARVADVLSVAQDTGVFEVADRLNAAALPDHKEHFGFRDGISQPSLEGGLVDRPGWGAPLPNGRWRPIKPGEFVMGYEKERIASPLPQEIAPLCLNGTYLVFRRLAQDVAAFRAFLRHAARAAFGSDDDAAQDRVGAKLVGRWKSGAPLPLAPSHDTGSPATDFRFGDDAIGDVCPRGAHIRRTNPRDALDGRDVDVQLHRLVRRGMPYGPAFDEAPEAERGLVFIAFNTDIEAQFEFIQEEWINKGEFADLSVNERDPIVGDNDDGLFTLPGASQSPFVFGVDRFVTTRGGGYFLFPGIAAAASLSREQA